MLEPIQNLIKNCAIWVGLWNINKKCTYSTCICLYWDGLVCCIPISEIWYFFKFTYQEIQFRVHYATYSIEHQVYASHCIHDNIMKFCIYVVYRDRDRCIISLGTFEYLLETGILLQFFFATSECQWQKRGQHNLFSSSSSSFLSVNNDFHIKNKNSINRYTYSTKLEVHN